MVAALRLLALTKCLQMAGPCDCTAGIAALRICCSYGVPASMTVIQVYPASRFMPAAAWASHCVRT